MGPPTEAPNSLRTKWGAAKLDGFWRALAIPIALFLAVSNAEPCAALVPDLVVRIAVAGVANWALELSVSTLTSCTASGSGNVACAELASPPKLRLVMGAP